MLPVIVKIHEYTLVTAIMLLAQQQNYDNLRRFMCTYKILLEQSHQIITGVMPE